MIGGMGHKGPPTPENNVKSVMKIQPHTIETQPHMMELQSHWCWKIGNNVAVAWLICSWALQEVIK